MARASVLDRNWIQGARERGQAVAENPSDGAPRVERPCPVLSAAAPLTLAAGSRVEDVHALKASPSAQRAPPKVAPERSRIVGAFSLGLAALSRLLAKGGMCAASGCRPNRGRPRLTD